MGTPHQMPSVPMRRASATEIGMRMSHSDRMVMNIGIIVSPAPRSRPVITNMLEKTA